MGILSSARLLLAGGKPRGKHDSKLAGSPPLRPRVPRNPRLWLEGLPYLPKLGRPIVISFMGKGGTGKTTSAVFIATIAAGSAAASRCSISIRRNRRRYGGAGERTGGERCHRKVVVHRCASRIFGGLDVARREGVDRRHRQSAASP